MSGIVVLLFFTELDQTDNKDNQTRQIRQQAEKWSMLQENPASTEVLAMAFQRLYYVMTLSCYMQIITPCHMFIARLN